LSIIITKFLTTRVIWTPCMCPSIWRYVVRIQEGYCPRQPIRTCGLVWAHQEGLWCRSPNDASISPLNFLLLTFQEWRNKRKILTVLNTVAFCHHVFLRDASVSTWNLFIHLSDGGSMFLRNVGVLQNDKTTIIMTPNTEQSSNSMTACTMR
jgi:hypothetical protein